MKALRATAALLLFYVGETAKILVGVAVIAYVVYAVLWVIATPMGVDLPPSGPPELTYP